MDPEKIFLSKSSFFPNAKFDWAGNLQNDVLVPIKMDTWILVCVDREIGKAQDFSKCLLEVAGKMGIRIAPPKMVGLPNDRTDTYVNRIREEIHPQVTFFLYLEKNSIDHNFKN